MAGFNLLPVEDGGSPVHLPEGETVLGRGPFLGVSDKRVSRHHGLLENLDGQLRIKPTHFNPCFCQSSLDDSPQPLDRNQWHTLKDGDIFSLLPGKYMYKVVAVDGDNGTLRNSQGYHEDCNKSPLFPEPSNEQAHPIMLQGKTSIPRSPEKVPKTLTVTTAKKEDPFVQGPTLNQTKSVIVEEKEEKPEPKKRVLPAWMMAGTTTPKSPSTPKDSGKRARGTSISSASRVAAASKQSRATEPISGEESEHSEVEQPRKRTKRKKSDEDEVETIAAPQAHKARLDINKVEDGEESDNLDMEAEDDGKKKGEGPTPIGSSSTCRVKPSEPENSQRTKRRGSSPESGPGGAKAQPRTHCPYGKECYRKNPLHFQECSHPGDSDYEEDSKEEEEDDSDRPECPYGIDCYRKNPLHRKEYKHTTSRAKRTVQKNYNDNEEEEDNSGDDDSFINDESEDMDEDSDYVPPDSDDSTKEDLKRLKKEAMAFVKKQNF
ncbi:aprataxin and PNK-like factor isoform X2 [Osmerus mordax]|uniref:aprataxin and PNK-like factor isoform X2 n=1 Tax=Osmerus mordax TaxID=8014 RepID=UPI00350FB1E9